MGDPCHPGGGGVCSGFRGFWLCSAPQHFTAALLPLRPQTTPKIPVECTQDTPREKLLLRHPCHTKLMQIHTERSREAEAEGGRRTQQPTLNLQGKAKSPLLPIHPCPPRQPIPSTAIFHRTSFWCTSSYKFKHQNKKRGARRGQVFRQAGSQPAAQTR